MVKYLRTPLLLLILFVVFFAPSIFAKDNSVKSNRAEDREARIQQASAEAELVDEVEDEDESLTPTPKKEIKPRLIKERIQKAKEKNQEIRENMKERASASAEKRAEKLSEARLKVCKARSKAIENRLKAMHKRASLIHKGHEKTYAKVDEFYNNRLVSNGYTLSNYADLKAEIAANKANVQALLDAATDTGTDFDCSSEDPKGQVEAFREDMKALIEANKTYKESIHVFVKAVRDLAKTAKLEKLSVTPTPIEEGAGE